MKNFKNNMRSVGNSAIALVMFTQLVLTSHVSAGACKGPRPPSPIRSRVARTSPVRTITIKRLPFPKALWGGCIYSTNVLQFSRRATWIAAQIQQGTKFARVYSVSTGESALTFLGPQSDVSCLQWSPRDSILGISYATGERLPPDMFMSRGFAIADMRSRRVKIFPRDEWQEYLQFVWSCGGRRMIKATTIIRLPEDDDDSLSVCRSPDYPLMATQDRFGIGKPAAPEVVLYRIKRTRGGKEHAVSIGRLDAEIEPKNGRVISFRTQPGYLYHRRLGFVKVFLDQNGKRKSVEVWTCRDDGTDERPWISLPMLGEGLPGWPYTVSPVTWSFDGRRIAYAKEPDKIVILRSDPPWRVRK